MRPDEPFDIDRLLQNRIVPESNPNWMQHIIQQACLTPQKMTFWQEFKSLLITALPVKPVYLMASILTLGILLGFSLALQQENATSQEMLVAYYATSLTNYHYGYQL